MQSSLDPTLLVPRVWPESYALAYHQQLATASAAGTQPEASTPVISSVADGLIATYAFNRPTAFETITHGHLQTMNLSHQSLHERALANLTEHVRHRIKAKKIALTPPSGSDANSDAPFFFQLEVGEDLEAACLLLSWLWQSLSANVVGELRVAVPAKNYFLFCGAGDPGFPLFQTVALNAFKDSGDSGLAAQIFAFRDCQIMPT